MADTLIKDASAPPSEPRPVLHPDQRRERLPLATWFLIGGALLAGIGAFLPWFQPSGRLDLKTRVPDVEFGAFGLIGIAGVAAIALALAGLLAIALVATKTVTLPGRLTPRKFVGWTGLVTALVTVFGLYADWRNVPEGSGVGLTAWDSASVSGYDVSVGPQLGVWFVLVGAVVASLAAASLLRMIVRVIALGYLGGLIVLPVYTVVERAFQPGVQAVWDLITSDPEFLASVRLGIVVAGIAVVANTVFGVGMALLLTRYQFPGRRLLSTFIDLPLAISPVVVGVALILVYGQDGWFGAPLAAAGIQVIFSTPGMVLGTIIVALPLVVREVVPVLEEAGTDQEQAAQSLGAGGFQTFRRITLPTIKWALAYGVVLSLARSIGEFGAVRVVSRAVSGESQTPTLYINAEYEQLGAIHKDNAFIGSFALMVVAVLFIVIIAVLRPKEKR